MKDVYSKVEKTIPWTSEFMVSKSAAFPKFLGEKVISLETYRRNGEPVRTPVWFLEKDGVVYVHTDDSTGKVKRIKGNPRVRIAPCHFRGKPKAGYIDAMAELETGPKTVELYRSRIYQKYGLQGKLARLLQRFSRSKAVDVLILIRP